MTRKFHSQTVDEVLMSVKSRQSGLTDIEVKKRLKKFGYNELPRQKPYSKLRLFFNQFNNPLIFILFGTIAVSLFLKHYSDTIFIVLVLLSNTLVGFYQENKAGNAILSLQKMVKIKARVEREKNAKEIDSRELVIGDIIILHAGDKIPADARIIESRAAIVNEASLTGESVGVKKKPAKISAKTEIAEQSNMVFMGTTLEEGWIKAVVVGTALNTQMGEIVRMLAVTQEAQTPLQIHMARLAKLTAAFILAIIGLILVIGIARFESTDEILLASLSLAVSAIPAGLLPAITVILVLAMRRIFRQNGLVKKLVANETLGSITVICTDKTGTLTMGKMAVTHLITKEREVYGKKLLNFNLDDADPASSGIKMLAKIAILDNDAILENPQAAPNEWITRGRITEQALLRASSMIGFNKQILEQEHMILDKVYFSSELKYSASLRQTDGDKSSLFVIGAPEYIFSKSLEVPKSLQEKVEILTKKGLRVLAAAYKKFDDHPEYKKLHDTVFGLNLVGLIALEDPIRPEVVDSIKLTQRAGIRTVIVTGDHKITAMFVAQSIGLKVTPESVVEGEELETMSDQTLRKKIKSILIFARVTPKHKLRIVDALQAHGEIVAMVGDGVNDAPALKSADIGVTLNSGTDVAKEVADLVLLDNGFHTIVKSIEQGRIIFTNIRKVFVYLLADDFQELYIFLAAMIFGMPLPLLPSQILWINLVEDGLPDLALTTEQEKDSVMDQRPRPKNEPVLNRPLKAWLTTIFLISGTAALLLFLFGLNFTGDVGKTRSMVFVLMGLDSLVFAFSVRSFRQTIFRRDIFSNKILVIAVLISFILLLTAVYTPGLQKLLSVQPLALTDWAIVFLISFTEIVFIEISKMHFLFKKHKSVVL